MFLKFRKSYKVVGYSYEADYHCVSCAIERFGDPDNPELEDSEGNPIHPLFLDQLEGGKYCGDCLEEIE